MSAPKYPAYKDSQVKWLGAIPDHWGVLQSRRMFAVRSEPALASDQMLTASQKYGVLFQKDFVEMEGRRVVEVIMGMESLKHVEPDDFIISMRSFQGGLEWSRLRGSTSFHYVMVKPLKCVHPPFFAHLFKSAQYIQALRSTTDLIRDGQELRYSNFVLVDLPLVPDGEQAAIAIFLDRETSKIDALVEEQKRLIELLKEKRQAVISQAVTMGLDPNVPMKDSGVEWLGKVPAHWGIVALKRLGSIRYGIGEPPKYQPDGVPLIRATNVHAGKLFDDGLVFVDPDDIPSQRIVWLAAGDIIVVRSGAYTGDSAIIPEAYGRCIAGFDMVVRCSNVIPQFLQFVLLSSYLKFFQIDLLKLRAAQPHLNAEELGACIVVVPPEADQADIVRFLVDQLSRIDTLIAEAEVAVGILRERRAALISAAVTGKIDVRGLVPQPEAVAA